MKESLTRMLGAASTLLLIGLFVVAVAPAGADEMKLRIKALEQELTQLKGEQEEVKEASLAAMAKLPTFSYRAPGGLWVTAGDKAWAINFHYRSHWHIYNHTDGADSHGGTVGDIFSRRNGLYFKFCWEGCFYEIQSAIDMDTGDATRVQTNAFYVKLGKINPYLPTIGIFDKGGQTASYVGRSSVSSATLELGRDLGSDSDIDTLSHRGIGMGWLNVPFSKEGDFLLWLEYKPGAAINRNSLDSSDRAQMFLKAGTRPFRKSKNKWLKKLKFGFGWQYDSVDTREGSGVAGAKNRFRVRSSDRVGRFAVYTVSPIGDGTHSYLDYGMEWGVGPWLLRANQGRSRWESENDGTAANLNTGEGVRGGWWKIANEIWLWSPKGAFTGSRNRAGSVLVGHAFARGYAKSDIETIHQTHLRQNEVSIWYWVRPMMSVGMWWNHWNSSNTPTSVQQAIGCKGNTTAVDAGKECSWDTVNLGLRLDW
jgi:hypothetical protein